MIQKIKKIISMILTAIFITMLFAGCGNGAQNTEKHYIDPTQEGSLALLVGKYRNNAQPALDSGVLNNDIVALAQQDGSKIAAIELDGNPYVICSNKIAVQSGASSSIKKQDANMYISNIGTAINDSVPQTAEVDILKGISIASRELTASDATDSNKVLYIMSNGLQTVGKLNMSQYNILDADADLLIEQIKDDIPNLESISKVVWLGIGDVADNQTIIDENNKNKLKSLWSAVIEEGGSSVDFINDNTTSVNNPDDWPSVSNVTIINNDLDIDAVIDVVKLDETKISFVSDKAEFVSESDAYEALKPIADILIKNTDMKVLIVGSTATDGTIEDCKDLSRLRADKVKNTLIEELHVNPNQLLTYGAGQSSTPFRVDDLDNNGNLIESEAAKNRAVYIVNSDSAVAKAFI